MINKRHIRTIEFTFIDMAIIVFAYWLGLLFVNEKNIFAEPYWLIIMSAIILITIIVMFILNLYNLVLEFIGFTEVMHTILSIFIANVVIYIIFLPIKAELFPYFVFLFISPIEIFLMLGLRFSKRILISFGIIYGTPRGAKSYINTLVIGAGAGGKLVLDEINKNVNLNNKIIAFVDDDPIKIHKRLNGIPIIGPISNSLEFVHKYNIQEIIIAIAALKPEKLRSIIKLFDNTSIKIKRLPLMKEISSDESPKIMDVKIEDLLSRDVIDLDTEGLLDFIQHKTVLVTGGGGSIGSELCQQILSYNPQTLIIFDIYENTTYDVQLDLLRRIKSEKRNVHLVTLIGSVYNNTRIEDVFATYTPNLVFHAAAYKHVPLMEDSAVEAVRTNVLGTYNVAKLCDKYHIQKMVLVSTDKAVRPTNVMGATKSCCEKIIQYFDSISETSYSAVRFGNVLGSHGSVVPLFKKQIAMGGPITITDKEITRYFMTIPEAVRLILQSGVYAKGGEIFILDMGEPVKIYDLAEKMIRLSGLIPHIDIKITEVGLRPGEKLYEELLLDREKHLKTQNDKIFIEQNGKTIANIEEFVATIRDQFEVVTNQEVKKLVQNLATTYIIDDKTNN